MFHKIHEKIIRFQIFFQNKLVVDKTPVSKTMLNKYNNNIQDVCIVRKTVKNILIRLKANEYSPGYVHDGAN